MAQQNDLSSLLEDDGDDLVRHCTARVRGIYVAQSAEA